MRHYYIVIYQSENRIIRRITYDSRASLFNRFNKLCFDYTKLQVKNEKFEQNMKNVLEIEKKNVIE